MTRKRTRESLAHMLCEPCPTCAGRGQVKTPRSVCYDVLREILREARQFNPREFRVGILNGSFPAVCVNACFGHQGTFAKTRAKASD
jgi:Ribonuclease G/E